MNIQEIATIVVPTAATIIGLYFAIETRQDKRYKKMMDDIEHRMDNKIVEYSNKVNSERMQQLERENERLREYARDKK